MERGDSIWGVIRKNPLEVVLCLVLVAIVAATFSQVLFRYVFRISLDWSEELARFLFMWMAALSSAYAFKTKSHFALRFVVNRFDARLRTMVNDFVMLSVSFFLIVFTYQAVVYTLSVTNQTAPGTQMSMAIPYSSAVIGGALMLYYVLRNWWLERGNQMATADD
jgi:TRAP-type C4-dicarboxylate transport system permease small subunit